MIGEEFASILVSVVIFGEYFASKAVSFVISVHKDDIDENDKILSRGMNHNDMLMAYKEI